MRLRAVVIVGETHEARYIFRSELLRRKGLTSLYSRFISSSTTAQFAQQTTSFLADETIRRSNRKSLRSRAPDIVPVAIINAPPSTSPALSPSHPTIPSWILRHPRPIKRRGETSDVIFPAADAKNQLFINIFAEIFQRIQRQ